jgi:hypothetical protein
MPSADEFWSAASEVSERGHLVIGFTECSEQPELGTTLENVLKKAIHELQNNTLKLECKSVELPIAGFLLAGL